jgi:hypothetical protein
MEWRIGNAGSHEPEVDVAYQPPGALRSDGSG